MATNHRDTKLSDYFSEDQLKAMGRYERTRNENLIRNYNYMKSIGIESPNPPFLKSRLKQKEVLVSQSNKPSHRISCKRPRENLQTLQNKENVHHGRPMRERKKVKRFQPPAPKLQVEKSAQALDKLHDGCNDFDDLAQIDLNSFSDISFDSQDLDWSSEDTKDVDTDADDNYELEQENQTTARKRKKIKRRGKGKLLPVNPVHNTKMIVHNKKVLPRRKCVSSAFNYKEDDVDNDDSYIYCEECQLESVGDCILHPLQIVADTYVPLGDDNRAKKTLPEGLSLSDSKIKHAGKGVWTDRKFDRFTRFGPYQGVKQVCKEVDKDDVSGYGWLVTGFPDPFYIDGEDVKVSNWLRYVNCARVKIEQNLEAFQYKGNIYYKTLRDIPIGHELLVWYGDDYATDLGIDKDVYATATLPTKQAVQTSKSDDIIEYYHCEVCNAKFVNKSSVLRHMKWHKQGSSLVARSEAVPDTPTEMDVPRTIRCTQCDFRCSYDVDLSKHMRCHTAGGETRFKCNQCDYRCARSGHLQTHMRTHTGEKPFKCNQCDYRCVHSGNLQTHMRTHTGEKPFKCNQCDYRCARSSALQTHMRTHTGEKPFKCNQCDYRCVHSGNLQTHMRTHTGEKPFKCNQCDYKCVHSGNLQLHMRTHTGEKPFKCNQCDYRCVHSGNLQKHMRTHTGENR